ncbi:hypothetical protein CBS101457_005270 [Exobasidium rhododendri]|nr:hypothetical protein CBS101457_005270 [Exobasidium rhododendri]
MATRRSGAALATPSSGHETPLFRGSGSPEPRSNDGGNEDSTMQVDVQESLIAGNQTTSASMPTTVEGDDVNFTPVIDENDDSEGLAAPFKKAEGVSSSSTSTELPNDANLLASLPVYFSTSLPSTSSLQIFQYPTYSRDRPLPVPESARSRALKEGIRYRPKAKRVEVELPLDLRPDVYDLDLGEELAAGASAGGTIGLPTMTKPKKEVKREYGTEDRHSQQLSSKKRLEKSRLESTLIPHQTQYMVGVIRDKALHLTPVDSILQLRPSMHYLDALDAIALQEKRRAQAEPGDETDEGSMTEDGGKTSKIKEKKKAQSLSVSVRGDQGGGPLGARGKGGVTDSRDLLMLADREAEGERWIDLDWKDETTDESKKTFDAQLFASSKTPLDCKTRPREFLQYHA